MLRGDMWTWLGLAWPSSMLLSAMGNDKTRPQGREAGVRYCEQWLPPYPRPRRGYYPDVGPDRAPSSAPLNHTKNFSRHFEEEETRADLDERSIRLYMTEEEIQTRPPSFYGPLCVQIGSKTMGPFLFFSADRRVDVECRRGIGRAGGIQAGTDLCRGGAARRAGSS